MATKTSTTCLHCDIEMSYAVQRNFMRAHEPGHLSPVILANYLPTANTLMYMFAEIAAGWSCLWMALAKIRDRIKEYSE